MCAMEKYSQTGVTAEGLPVVSGTFKYYDRFGLSVMDILTKLKSMALVPDLLDFYTEARKHGWSHQKARNTVVEGIREVFGSQAGEKAQKALDYHWMKGDGAG